MSTHVEQLFLFAYDVSFDLVYNFCPGTPTPLTEREMDEHTPIYMLVLNRSVILSFYFYLSWTAWPLH